MADPIEGLKTTGADSSPFISEAEQKNSISPRLRDQLATLLNCSRSLSGRLLSSSRSRGVCPVWLPSQHLPHFITVITSFVIVTSAP